MEDAQKILVDNGKIYILWSVLAILAIALKFIKDVSEQKFSNLWIYVPIIVIGWLGGYLLKKRSYSEVCVKSFTQKILEGIWTGMGVAIPILVVVGYISGGIKSWAIPPVIATIFGSLHYTSGIVSGNSWIRYSSIGWWGAAIVMFVLPGDYAIALLGGLLIFLQLVPGIVLYKKWKNDIAVDTQ